MLNFVRNCLLHWWYHFPFPLTTNKRSRSFALSLIVGIAYFHVNFHIMIIIAAVFVYTGILCVRWHIVNNKICISIIVTFSIFIEAMCYLYFFIKYLFKCFAHILICIFSFLCLIFENSLCPVCHFKYVICSYFLPEYNLPIVSSMSFKEQAISHCVHDFLLCIVL